MRRNNPLLSVVFLCMAISLIFTLLPLSDFNNDGLLDSISFEGFILLPVLISIAGCIFLIRLITTWIAPPALFFSPLNPPPILHN